MRSRTKPIAGVVLRAYKLTLSPLFMAVGVRCRHEPTCSEYAADAVSRHGVWAGLWMAVARFQRCRPWGSHGFDPVPQTRRPVAWWAPWRHGDWCGPCGQGGCHRGADD